MGWLLGLGAGAAGAGAAGAGAAGTAAGTAAAAAPVAAGVGTAASTAAAAAPAAASTAAPAAGAGISGLSSAAPSLGAGSMAGSSYGPWSAGNQAGVQAVRPQAPIDIRTSPSSSMAGQSDGFWSDLRRELTTPETMMQMANMAGQSGISHRQEIGPIRNQAIPIGSPINQGLMGLSGLASSYSRR